MLQLINTLNNMVATGLDNIKDQIRPNEPAVNPTAQKKVNSRRSLGRELTINFIWVIWPCAPQVYKFLLS